QHLLYTPATLTLLLTILPPFFFSPSFFFNAPAPTPTYTLSLHDALPISSRAGVICNGNLPPSLCPGANSPATRKASVKAGMRDSDRKSTRLNSSHVKISYAVFCLKKKKKKEKNRKIYSIIEIC